MNLNWWSIGAGILYIGAGCYSSKSGHYAVATMWFSYAIANFALSWAEAHS